MSICQKPRIGRLGKLQSPRMGNESTGPGRLTDATFGELLRQYRGDMTRTRIAASVGVSENYIAQLEAGRRTPSNKLAVRLADHLKLKGDDRSSFLATATGLGVSVASADRVPSAASRALGRFLEMQRTEGDVDGALEAVLGELFKEVHNAAISRGAGRNTKAAVRGLQLLGEGLLNKDSDSDAESSTHRRRQENLRRELLAFLAHVADGELPLNKRLAVLREVNHSFEDVKRRSGSKG